MSIVTYYSTIGNNQNQIHLKCPYNSCRVVINWITLYTYTHTRIRNVYIQTPGVLQWEGPAIGRTIFFSIVVVGTLLHLFFRKFLVAPRLSTVRILLFRTNSCPAKYPHRRSYSMLINPILVSLYTVLKNKKKRKNRTSCGQQLTTYLYLLTCSYSLWPVDGEKKAPTRPYFFFFLIFFFNAVLI